MTKLIEACTAGVIALCKSSVFYTNQSGGYACKHPAEEGVLITLSSFDGKNVDDLPHELFHYFTCDYGKYKGHCSDGIDEEDADYLDDRFKIHNLPWRVDRARLKDSMEAWVYVTILKDVKYLVEGFEGCKGVLVWGNSD